MNILIAPDAFKDCLEASEVAQAMKDGVLLFVPTAICHTINASDGGEGFLNAAGGYLSEVKRISMHTTDPLGRDIVAQYLWDENNMTAYIELALASGLELLSETERNPMHTSTFGTGLQIKHAIGQGATNIYLGIGGSATNDAATGLAQALGFRFLDSEGADLSPKGSSLSKIRTIVPPDRSYEGIRFFAVNDVLNSLHGPSGAAFTYARQKGANPDEIALLDKGLAGLDALIQQQLEKDEAHIPGSGAAGGTAYGLRVFFDAEFISGTSFMLNLSRFATLVSEAKIELIITGEGRIDHQTAFGKFVYGISQEAKKYNIPVLAICGKLEATPSEIKQIGLTAVAELYNPTLPKAYSFDHAAALISEKTIALLKGFRKHQSTR